MMPGYKGNEIPLRSFPISFAVLDLRRTGIRFKIVFHCEYATNMISFYV